MDQITMGTMQFDHMAAGACGTDGTIGKHPDDGLNFRQAEFTGGGPAFLDGYWRGRDGLIATFVDTQFATTFPMGAR